MATSSNSRSLLLLLLISGFFITGLLFDYMPMIVDNQIKRTVELATNEEIQSIWSKPPVDFNSYYWLYDILNAEQFLAGDKIRVRKVGPYHFTSRAEKRIIQLSQNKLKLVYNATRYFAINESSQALSLDAPLTLLNPIYASLLEAGRRAVADMNSRDSTTALTSAQRLADRFNESLFLNTTAREALLGRKLVFMEKVRKLVDTFNLDMDLPDMLPGNVFGYVAASNGTWQGPFEIYTGYQASMPSLGDLISFKGKRRLTEFQGKCNRLQSSVGELRPMPIGNEQLLEIFLPSFCRILHLEPTGLHKLREGQAISYVLAARDFLSAELNPDNRCFCLNGTGPGADSYCSLNGALELAPCSHFSPLVLTPNNIEPDARITGSLQDWDPELMRADVEQLAAPDNTSQLLVLKRIGVPVAADLTMTLFMKVIRDPRFRQTGSVPEESYIPIMMVRETVRIPAKLAQIVVNLESFLALSHHIKVIMYLSTVVLTCWLTGHYYGGSSGGGGGGGANTRGSGSSAGVGKSGSDRERVGPARRASGRPDSGLERANSGDSSRSQPPSRLSGRSSPDGAAMSIASGDSHRIDPVGQPARAAKRAPRQDDAQQDASSAAAESRPPGESASGQQAAGSGEKTGARLFSQLDDQIRLRSAESEKETAGELAASDGAPPAGEPDDEQTEPASERRRKNWFMKVCSNFVRMLNGIRSSLNDASQLDISANDYQDKQLEMLAGKIDNWYQTNTSETSRELADGGGRAGEPTRTDAAASEQGESVAIKPVEGVPEEPAAASVSGSDGGHSRELSGTPTPPLAASASVRARKESEQSEQTVINAKSETSGDESLGAGSGTVASSSGEDKQAALEQLERTLGSSPVEWRRSEAERGPEEPRHLMIDSSTSMDSAMNANIGPISQPADRSAGPSERAEAVQEAATSTASSSSSSSVVTLKQSNKLGANEAAAELAGDISAQFDPPATSDDLAAKDERRDSGVKLDSRNGINESSQSSGARNSSGWPEEASIDVVVIGSADCAAIGAEAAQVNASRVNDIRANGKPISNHSGQQRQTKLPNASGNNISNRKLMLQGRTNDAPAHRNGFLAH